MKECSGEVELEERSYRAVEIEPEERSGRG
jgi:hypothetical protein